MFEGQDRSREATLLGYGSLTLTTSTLTLFVRLAAPHLSRVARLALTPVLPFTDGLKSYETRYGFTNAQSFMNIVESALNFAYLYKTWVDPSEVAPLIGFTAVVMTVSKTVLYALMPFWSPC